MQLKSIPLWGGLCLLFSAGTATAQIPANTVAASTNHSARIHPDGSLWTWGMNMEGQLGNGTTKTSTIPVRVQTKDPSTRWVKVATGTSHTLAQASDGRLYAWGSNQAGQLGDGTTTSHLTPVAVELPASAANATWKQLAAGTSHSIALTADGRIYAWGHNSSGQLGNGHSRHHAVPTEVTLPVSAANTTWAEVAAGNGHTLAITADGRLFAWGNNDYGQLGDGSTTRSLVPVAVGMTRKLAGLRWAHVATGRFHTLAVTRDGRLYGWGSNRFGQLADNDDALHYLPVAIAMAPRQAKTVWTQVAAGDAHSMALSADGQLVAWGNNCVGQLGNGATTWQLTPVPAAMPENAPATTFTRIVSGGFHSLAQTADGQLYAWGANLNGQLGDGTTTNRERPTSQDPALTSQLESGSGSTAEGGHTAGVEPWGLNDNRLMDELPESPNYTMIVRPQDDFRP